MWNYYDGSSDGLFFLFRNVRPLAGLTSPLCDVAELIP